MPEIQLKHIVSSSSEDRNNPAENLLKAEGTHKWRTASPGEKNATVVIQFEKSSQIHSVDIGNEGSAFVEVLVGKSTSAADADYQVLLVSSSFMGPMESRNGTNRNAVRIFGLDKLSKTVAPEKWDRVKIVCTQPFNKTTAYGLSFIKFHSPPDGSSSSKPEQKKLGAFLIRKEDDDDDIKAGMLFASRGKKEEASPSSTPTAAAAVRAASRLAEESRKTASPSPSRGRNSASPTPIKTTPAASASRASPATAKGSPLRGKKKHAVSDEGSDTEEDAPPPRTGLKKQSTSLSSVASSRSSDAPPPLKKSKTEPPKESPAKEFGRLMEKVVFALSGFQNPYRGELREKALEMGAIYKPDWGKGCTHLVCAFTSTPKYNQVKGRGKIISKQWIIDCHKQKKLLPWRKYRLGDAESPDESSDDEEVETPRKAAPTKTPSKTGSASKTPTPQSKKKPGPAEELYGGDTDSADDTDEEIRRAKVKATARQKAMESKTPQKDDTDEDVKVTAKAEVKDTPKEQVRVTEDATLAIFEDSTDEDELGTTAPTDVAMDMDDGADSGLPDLPDFFAEKHFFFYGDFDAKERRLLSRYIAAYDGVLEDYMNDRVKYVVTSTSWDDNFEEALSENPGLIFVKPNWIHTCHDKSKLIPHQPYVVVP